MYVFHAFGDKQNCHAKRSSDFDAKTCVEREEKMFESPRFQVTRLPATGRAVARACAFEIIRPTYS